MPDSHKCCLYIKCTYSNFTLAFNSFVHVWTKAVMSGSEVESQLSFCEQILPSLCCSLRVDLWGGNWPGWVYPTCGRDMPCNFFTYFGCCSCVEEARQILEHKPCIVGMLSGCISIAVSKAFSNFFILLGVNWLAEDWHVALLGTGGQFYWRNERMVHKCNIFSRLN